MLTTDFWRKYFKTYDVLNIAIPYVETIEKIASYLPDNKKLSVFDAGSGTGNLSILLKKTGHQVVGLDYSIAGIELHKIKDKEAAVIHGDLTTKLPFDDNYFDAVVSNNVIYTLPVKKWNDIFIEFNRVLKPGGLIIISNINKDFKPLRVLLVHMRISISKQGILKTAIDFFTFLPAVIKMLYYNKLIKKENSSGGYNFVEKGMQSSFLEKSGFSMIEKDVSVYADQALLDVARKV